MDRKVTVQGHRGIRRTDGFFHPTGCTFDRTASGDSEVNAARIDHVGVIIHTVYRRNAIKPVQVQGLAYVVIAGLAIAQNVGSVAAGNLRVAQPEVVLHQQDIKDRCNGDVAGGHEEGVCAVLACGQVDLCATAVRGDHGDQLIALVRRDGQGDGVPGWSRTLVANYDAVLRCLHADLIRVGEEGGNGHAAGRHREAAVGDGNLIAVLVSDGQAVQPVGFLRGDGERDGVACPGSGLIGGNAAAGRGKDLDGIGFYEGTPDGHVGGGHGELIVRHFYGLVLAVGYSQCVQLPALVGRDGQGDGVARMG